VVRKADWIIDLGPEGGSRGGQVMFEGTPADLKKAKMSITSQYV
jgi:excinuclease UvrABC ATPase subunit